MSVPMCVKHSSPVLDFESRAAIFSTATSHLVPWLTVYLNLQTGKVSGQGLQFRSITMATYCRKKNVCVDLLLLLATGLKYPKKQCVHPHYAKTPRWKRGQGKEPAKKPLLPLSLTTPAASFFCVNTPGMTHQLFE